MSRSSAVAGPRTGIFALAVATAAGAQQPVPIGDAGFENGALGGLPNGWVATQGTMYVTPGFVTAGDPPAPYAGMRFLSATWQAIGLTASPYPAGQTMALRHDVDLSPWAGLIDAGDRQLELSFAVNAADGNDHAIVGIELLDGGGAQLASPVEWSSAGSPTPAQAWQVRGVTAPVPAGARTARLALRGERPTGAGSARNVNFDALAMMLAPYVPPPPPDRVHGDLLQLDPNGGWCWYQDERAVVDRARGELLVGSIGSYGGLGGQTEDGLVQVSHVDLASRRRTLHTLDDIESYGGGDDHNVPGFVVKQDGDVLACYAAHNQRDGTLDDRSYLRTFDVATASWGAVTEWHWWPVIPANAPGSGGTTYANVFQLAAEDPDHDTHGRLYNFARTQQSPHTMYSDDNGATWIYGGQLTEAPSATPAGNNYVNGYYRYWSNGVDRIDLIATEYHPRDFNTSIYHAYIQGGRMYDSAGNVIDNDIFDAAGSFHSANVPSTDDMTPVFVCDGIQWSRAWNTDVHAFADGTVVALFKARPVPYDPNASVGDGDHRVFYGRLDPTTLTWSTHEVCKAGARLFAGEQDYTGLGAIDPRDPDRIWISTEVHPVQDVLTDHHEIYEGRTADDGASWSWRALTADSTVDNRRPIAPAWDAHHTALLWWRGDHANSIVRDTAVVGLLLADDEERAPLAYVDADSGNTARADGAPWNVTSGSGAGAADGQWHRRTGFGNGGDVFTADESGAEDVPLLRTTVTGLPAGRYDVFACFWTDSADWRIAAGLAADELMVYRRHGAQSALAVDFGDPLLDREGNRTLMRAYLGRVELAAAQPLEVFVDDAGDGSATRTWFDGVALAPVAAQAFGVGCGDPQLALLPEPGARPVFGATARALVTGAPTAIAALALGFSRSALGPTPLPLDLGPWGMPGCALLQSAELAGLPLQPVAPGTLAFALAIPAAPALVGLRVYLQAAAYAPLANALGVVASNGLEWWLSDR